MKIESLHFYPIKSCGGVDTSTLHLSNAGPVFDREFMLVDKEGKFISQRQYPQLSLVKTAIEGQGVLVSIPGMKDIRIEHSVKNGVPRRVSVWDDECLGLEVGDGASEPFRRFLGADCTLVQMHAGTPRVHHSSALGESAKLGFADGYPLLVVSQASLDDLNGRMDNKVPMNRFRPNIVVSGCEPYAEDSWKTVQGGTAVQGGELRLRFAKLCKRCAIPTIDQETATRSEEPVRTLMRYRVNKNLRGVVFGSVYVYDGTGALRVGDELLAA